MPYLDPAEILREFSGYAATEIRPAIAEDEEFMRGQVGSMASTLRFLAGELEGMDEAVDAQRASLLEALAETVDVVDDPETVERLDSLREDVEGPTGDPRAVEATVLEAADEALALVDDLDEPIAREAREPLYTFLDDRLDAQLRLLGRPPDDG
jgi:hypothetical protein